MVVATKNCQHPYQEHSLLGFVVTSDATSLVIIHIDTSVLSSNYIRSDSAPIICWGIATEDYMLRSNATNILIDLTPLIVGYEYLIFLLICHAQGPKPHAFLKSSQGAAIRTAAVAPFDALSDEQTGRFT